jgi:hypothetical protein
MGRRTVLTRVLRAFLQRLDPVKNPMHAKVEPLVQAPAAGIVTTTALTARETAGYRSGSISLVSTRLHERGSPRPPPLLGQRGREVEP